MWQDILKQDDRPLYVEEINGAKILRLEGYEQIRNDFPLHALLLPQEGGNPLSPPHRRPDRTVATSDAAIKKSIAFANNIINTYSQNIRNITMVSTFPHAALMINIKSNSDEDYLIKIFHKLVTDEDINVTGSYEDLDINLCIDAEKALPIGDLLGTYILSLINDEDTCEHINTLQDFKDRIYFSEIVCPICDEETSFTLRFYESVYCDHCGMAYFYDIEYGNNEAGETYVPINDKNTQFINPRNNNILEMTNVANMGNYLDKFFIDEISDPPQLLHFDYYKQTTEYYDAKLDERGDYHASTGILEEFEGDDYLLMGTGFYHKVLGDKVASAPTNEAELRRKEEE